MTLIQLFAEADGLAFQQQRSAERFWFWLPAHIDSWNLKIKISTPFFLKTVASLPGESGVVIF